MDDAVNPLGSDHILNLVVIANVSFDQRDFGVVLRTQVGDAGFKALVERVIDDDILAVADEFISDMCADVSSASGKQPRLSSHVEKYKCGFYIGNGKECLLFPLNQFHSLGSVNLLWNSRFCHDGATGT